jgi:hypothetical protein
METTDKVDVEGVIVPKVRQSKTEELASADLELKRLELELKRTELQDAQERIDERKVKREDRSSKARTNGENLRSIARTDAITQAACQHHKGGFGLEGIYQGSDPQFSVIKHTMYNGDTWVRCQRCGKTWKPPIEDDFYFDAQGKQVEQDKGGKFNEEAFKAAVKEYDTALHFQTLNSTSSSYTFRFSDGGKQSRKAMRYTNLR